MPHTCRGGNRKSSIPDGSPIPVAVRLRIMAFAVAGRTAVFLTIADPFFSLLRGSPDRSAVTGKSQMIRIDQSSVDGTIQELLFVETENKGNGFSGFKFQRSSRGRSLEAVLEESQGVLSPFFFPLGGFILENDLSGKIVPVVLPDAGKEIIKSPDAGSIPKGKPLRMA